LGYSPGETSSSYLPSPSTLLSPSDFSPSPFHPVIFDNLDGVLVRCTILRMDGAAGPSGLDVTSWKKLCTCFKNAYNTLCDALSAVARRLATTFIDPTCLDTFTACRLIVLDKHPGVQPIGVGEVCWRLLSKTVLSVIRNDVLQAAGPLQLCTGQPADCEAAIHAMRAVFDSPDAETVLHVDPSNAFNCLNWQGTLRNIFVLCPSFARILLTPIERILNFTLMVATFFSRKAQLRQIPRQCQCTPWASFH